MNGFSTNIIVTPGSDGGRFISSVTVDTVFVEALSGTWSYLSFGGVRKVGNPIVVTPIHGIVNMTLGIALENCSNFKITGSGQSSRYGFRIVGAVTSGVAITCKGLCDHVEWEYIYGQNKYYAAWVKNEAADYPCDSTYWFPAKFDFISIHDCYFTNMFQDGFYLGSTDPYGTSRYIICSGDTIYPRPTALSNISVYNDTMLNCGRTGMQLSNAAFGANTFHNNYIANVGMELNFAQGAAIALGGATQNTTVYNNVTRRTFNYSIYSYNVDTCYFHDNNTDSTGYVTGFDNNLHTNTGVYPFMINSFSNPPSADSTNFIICDNTFGSNSNPDTRKIELNNTTNMYRHTGSVIGNSGTIKNNGGVVYSTSCSTSPPSCTTNSLPVNGDTLTTTTTATLTWASSSGATSYDVYLGATGGSLSLVTNTGSLTYAASGLTQGTSYTWYIVPKNGGGDATGCINDTTSFVTLATSACDPPTGLSSGSVGIHSAVVSWTASGTATDYTVQYRIVGAGSFTTWTTTASTTATILGLKRNTNYRWRVRSNCAGDTHSVYQGANFKTLNVRSLTIIHE